MATACSAGRSETAGARRAANRATRRSTKNLTQIPPDQRTSCRRSSGPALGSEEALSSKGLSGPGRGDQRLGLLVRAVSQGGAGPAGGQCRDGRDVAQFLGINTKDLDPAPAEAFVRANKITYPSIYDPSGRTLLAFAGDLPPSAIPSTLIIDREGRLAVRVLGDDLHDHPGRP